MADCAYKSPNKKKRRVLFLTGTRADFGKMKPLIDAVDQSGDFEAHVFITGMHMLARYGATAGEVQEAGYRNIFTYFNQIDSPSTPLEQILANTIQGLSHYVYEHCPDLLVIHGDRVEALAGAITGLFKHVLVAHIEGGELSGTMDEIFRHAISKFAHVHFVANGEARKRLIQMGELKETIFSIGSPDIDVMLSGSLPSLDEVRCRYGISFSKYAIFSYHPVTSELDALPSKIEAVLRGLLESNLNYVVIYPNNDPGSDIILEAISELKDYERFRVLPSMRFEYFLTLLKHAVALVGNSSAGVREAPVYGVPTVNIGSRQLNRYNCKSITNVEEDIDAIVHALRTLPKTTTPSLHFGKGNSAKFFLNHLRDSAFWCIKHQKQFQDLMFFPPLISEHCA